MTRGESERETEGIERQEGTELGRDNGMEQNDRKSETVTEDRREKTRKL